MADINKLGRKGLEQLAAAMTPNEIQGLRNNLNEVIGKFFSNSGLPPTAATLYHEIFYESLTGQKEKELPSLSPEQEEIITRAKNDYWKFFMAATLDDTPIELYKILGFNPEAVGHGELLLVPGSPYQAYRGVLFTVKNETAAFANAGIKHVIETPTSSQVSGVADLFSKAGRAEFNFVKDSIDKMLADQSEKYITTVPWVSISASTNPAAVITPNPGKLININSADLKAAQNIGYFYEMQAGVNLEIEISLSPAQARTAER